MLNACPLLLDLQTQLQAYNVSETIYLSRALFRQCRTVAFDDWSALGAASELWDGLLMDVIKPLGRQDIEFIFYLGDSRQKLSFQVDEVLDIISDFAQHGQVTFALDEDEALKLWMEWWRGVTGEWQEKRLNEQCVQMWGTWVESLEICHIWSLRVVQVSNKVLRSSMEMVGGCEGCGCYGGDDGGEIGDGGGVGTTCDVEGSSCDGGGVIASVGDGGVGSATSSSSTSSAACCGTNIPSNNGVSTLENPFPTLLILAKTFCVWAGDEYFVLWEERSPT
nr:hypothetical protein [Tanacetum cinerariifolium]